VISYLDMMAGDEAKKDFASLDGHNMSLAVSLGVLLRLTYKGQERLLIEGSNCRVQVNRKQVRHRTFRLLNDQARLDLCLVTGSRLAPSSQVL
jgi:hypothetical protein